MLTTCPKCGNKFDHDPTKFDPEDPIVKSVKKYMNDCEKKFKENNPCPKCGSHNVDVDWGTQVWCNDCGYRWD